MFHAEQMIAYGTKVVAGVTPGKGGQSVLGVPVFNTVAEAVKQTGANVSLVFVPARLRGRLGPAKRPTPEWIWWLVISEHIPVMDMIRAKAFLNARGVKMVGPNCPGIITPGECKIGIQPGYIHKPGTVGLVSRSGTLTYEVVHQLTSAGLGQSTCIGIGGDPHHRPELRAASGAVPRRSGNRGGVPHRRRSAATPKKRPPQWWPRAIPSRCSALWPGSPPLRASAWATPGPSSAAPRAGPRTSWPPWRRRASPWCAPWASSAKASQKNYIRSYVYPAKLFEKDLFF